MVQHSLILSAIALLGMSHMMLGDVEAAPSVDAARRLFGRVYNSHRLYSSNVIFEENTDANSTSTGNDTCPIEIGNNTLDAFNHFQGIFFGDYANYFNGSNRRPFGCRW